MEEKNAKRSILVVDDEAGIRQLLEFELQSAGYEIKSAANGKEALELIQKNHFELVITDVMMPGMSGIDLLKEIKKINPSIEVIVGTGYSQVENAVTAMKLGAYDYVQKPFSIDEMLSLVEKALEKSQLRQSRDEALEASRAKSEFLATMSHEIRTPLNAIIGMAELLAETTVTDEQKKYIEILQRGGETLLSLINDILDLSKIEAGHLELEVIEFDLEELVERTAEFVAVRAHKKGLELTCHIAPDVPHQIMGDSTRLRQVLINLMGNAIKFTEKGEVVVEVKKRKGLEDPKDNKIELHFSIRDTGIGIPADKLTAIFEPFTQADSSTTRKFGGSGLGLSISKRIVTHMAGNIWVESVEGKGSTFNFVVTLQLPSEIQKNCIIVPPPDLKGLKTLIIDDNATNRFILREALLDWEAKVNEAEGGAAGLDELRRAKAEGTPYGLLLLDCRMPEMDGFGVAQRIQNDPDLSGIVVMMLSSDARQGDIVRSKELGIISYLVKPVKRSDLLNSITAVMNQSRAGQGGRAGGGPKSSKSA